MNVSSLWIQYNKFPIVYKSDMNSASQSLSFLNGKINFQHHFWNQPNFSSLTKAIQFPLSLKVIQIWHCLSKQNISALVVKASLYHTHKHSGCSNFLKFIFYLFRISHNINHCYSFTVTSKASFFFSLSWWGHKTAANAQRPFQDALLQGSSSCHPAYLISLIVSWNSILRCLLLSLPLPNLSSLVTCSLCCFPSAKQENRAWWWSLVPA